MRMSAGQRVESYYVLEAVWLKGQGMLDEVMKLAGLSDKTAKALAQALLASASLTTDGGSCWAPYQAA